MQSELRQGVLVSVEVLPSLLFLNFIIFVLGFVHSDHLSLLLGQLHFILQHQLSIGLLLHSPLLVLHLLSGLLLPIISHLLCSLSHNLVLLVWV